MKDIRHEILKDLDSLFCYNKDLYTEFIDKKQKKCVKYL